MAKNDETTTRFRVDISELKSAMQEAKRQVAIANSEFKAVSASMDDWKNSTDGLQAKLKQLDSNLNSQKAILDNLQKQYDLTVQEMGEGSEAADRLKIAINNQQAVVNKTEQDIKKYSGALSDLEKEADGSDDSLEKLGDKAEEAGKDIDKAADEAKDAGSSFEGLGEICKGVGAVIATAFAAVTAAAAAAGKALVDMAVDGAAFADTVLTEATVTGIATDKLQEYMYAAELVDVSTETLTGSMAKQIKSMKSAQDGSKSMVAAYSELGVSVKNADGSLRDSEAVYWEVVDALGKVENETERDAIAMQILGKSAQELNPLIEQGATRMQELGEQAHAAGYVMSDDMLNAFGAFDDQLQYMKVGADAAKNALGTVLLPVLTELAGEGVSLLGEFTNGILDANGDIGKMSDVIGDVLSKAVDKIVEFVPQVLDVAGKIVGALGNGLINNLPTILQSVASVAFSLLTALTEAVLNSLPMLLETGVQIAVSLIDGLSSAVPRVIQTVVDIIPKLLNALLGAIPQLIDGIISAVPQILSAISSAVPQIIESVVDIVPKLITALLEQIPTFLKACIDFLLSLVEAIPTVIDQLLDAVPDIIDALIEGLLGGIDELLNGAIKLLTAIINAIPKIIPALINALPQIIDSVINALIGAIPILLEASIKLFMALVKAIPTVIASLIAEVPKIVVTIVDILKTLPEKMLAIGKSIVEGIWNGISDKFEWIKGKISGWVGNVTDFLKGLFGINSPSKLMSDEIGRWLPEGIALGVDKNAKSVLSSMRDMTTAAVGAARDGLVGGSSGGVTSGGVAASGGRTIQFHQTINSPKQLDRLTIYRQTKNLLGYAGGTV